MEYYASDPERTNLNRILRTLDPHENTSLEDETRAALEERAQAYEREMLQVGVRSQQYAELKRKAQLVRDAIEKVGQS